MNTLRWERVARDRVGRVVADVLMVNVALVAAYGFRFIWIVGVDSGYLSPQATLQAYVHSYVLSSWLITAISICVFAASGFYSHGRAYRGRYKALMVAQAVAVSYLVFGFLAFFLDIAFHIPRGVVVMGWIITTTLIVGARLWSTWWRATLQSEPKLAPAQRRIKLVLVIGGDGYIGSALLPKLLVQGYHVRVLSLFLYGMDAIEPLLTHPNLELIKADFRQVDKVVEAMQEVDAVVHLGAIVGDPACALDENLTVDVNLMATRMIAEVAKGQGVNRFVFASTCSVYGASDETLDEHSALNPVSLYAQSKIACERGLQSMADEHFAPVILRFGTIFGLSGRTRFDLVVNLLSAKAAVDGEITVAGADQWRPFVHVDDAALAVLRTIEAPLALVRNEIFNVGGDHLNFTIGQVGEIIHELVPDSRIVDLGWASDRRNYRVSFLKIRKELDFSPLWTVEMGVHQVLDAIATGRVTNYRDPKFSNVKFLSEEGFPLLTGLERNWAWNLKEESSSQRDDVDKTAHQEPVLTGNLV